jgi:hypothetical protein
MEGNNYPSGEESSDCSDYDSDEDGSSYLSIVRTAMKARQKRNMQKLWEETKDTSHELDNLKTRTCKTGRRVCRYCKQRRCFTACRSCLPYFSGGICMPLEKYTRTKDNRNIHTGVHAALTCFQQHVLEHEETVAAELVGIVRNATYIKDLGSYHVFKYRKLLPKSPTDLMQPHHLKNLKNVTEVPKQMRCSYCNSRTRNYCSSCHVRSRSQPIPICLPRKDKTSCYNQHIHEDFDRYVNEADSNC